MSLGGSWISYKQGRHDHDSKGFRQTKSQGKLLIGIYCSNDVKTFATKGIRFVVIIIPTLSLLHSISVSRRNSVKTGGIMIPCRR